MQINQLEDLPADRVVLSFAQLRTGDLMELVEKDGGPVKCYGLVLTWWHDPNLGEVTVVVAASPPGYEISTTEWTVRDQAQVAVYR